MRGFADRFDARWLGGMRSKLGVAGADSGDPALVNDLLAVLHDQRVDHTRFFRRLSSAVAGDLAAVAALVPEPTSFHAWAKRWLGRVHGEGRDPATVAAAMDAVNPVYIPRNHLVEEALAAASTAGDLHAAAPVARRGHSAVPRTSRRRALRRAGAGFVRTLPDLLRYLTAPRPIPPTAACRSGGRHWPINVSGSGRSP